MAYQPMYKKIASDLRNAIDTKSLSTFPSEQELMKSYKVSRTTIRKSLELLKETHVIQSHRGRGTKIIKKTTPHPAGMPNTNRQIIGLVMAGFTDSYGTSLLKAIQAYALKMNYFVIMRFSNQSAHDEALYIKQLIDFGVAGLLVFPVENYAEKSEVLTSNIKRVPTVLLDRQIENYSLPIVSTDNYHAAKTLTKLLLQMGHVNTVFMLRKGSNNSAMDERIRGIKDAYHDFQRTIPDDAWQQLDIPDATSEHYYDRFQKSLDEIRNRLVFNKKFTCYMALYFSCINTFIIAKDSLTKKINRVSFLGFDGPPYLTSDVKYNRIVQDEGEIAHQAIKLLDNLINGVEVPSTKILIEPKYLDNHSVFPV
ncbi:hypothetical protein PDA01_10960 [Pediococcus damnosus]|uniref:GntR family transcriptional regulator n=1 Tax=Pediococcus damnosus TaxID=51663 RepID=UPI001143E1D9|nr:LacI family DNA-binding transcriptional regulator [Pediococcus damnosus]GEA93203.1 hypothetical protein PDA01_10960 [Pediococcus damnosus]